MSASDEETFASAEEGDDVKDAGKSAKGKTKPGESSKSSQAAAKDKGGGKGKGKQQQQQQQQRKKKTKAQPKSPTEEKAESSQKPPGDISAPADSTEVGESADKKKDKTDIALKSDATSKPESGSSESSQASTDRSVGSKAEPHSENQESKLAVDSASKTEGKSADNLVSEGTPVTPAKSAGEIRQSLSSDTAAEDVKNPEKQVIPRDAGAVTAGSETTETVQKETGKTTQGGGSWGWGWGSSILSAATNSLETFSSQVGEGLTTIIDSVESSLGVPDPEDLARADQARESEDKPDEEQTVTAQPHEKERSEEPAAKTSTETGTETCKPAEGEEAAAAGSAVKGKEETSKQGSSWMSGWGMSSISDMGRSFVNKSQNLMNTGFEKAENLAAGGLDILETIGKKTYTTLTEHDPGLRRAREFLHLKEEKQSLSSVLREAQEQAEEAAKHNEELEEARKCNFTALFEDNQGLAHLEALEMLSNRSERKVQSLLSAMDEETLEGMRGQLMEIKDVFQQSCQSDTPDQAEDSEHEFSKLVTENLSELHLGTAPDKLNQVQDTVRQWIADFYSHEHSEISDAKEVHQHAIQSLADITSKAVEQFHKAGELVLMQKDEEKSCTQRAQSLAKLSSVLVTEVDILATKFSQCLNKIGEENSNAEEVGPLVTSVYVEASNASGYIQDAFQLLLPVLQHAAIQSAL